MAAAKKNIKKKKVVKKGRKKVVVPTVEGLYQEAIKFVAESFRGGNSEQRVAEVLTQTYKQFSPHNIQYVIHKGSQQIANQYSRDRKSIVSLHVKRYNREIDTIMTWFSEEEYLKVPEEFRRDVMKGKLDNAIAILGAKERVLQMHSKDTQVRIFNKLNAKVKEKKVMFDLSCLSLQEKIQFLSLIQKAKKTQNELFGITSNDNKQDIVTEDIEHELIEEPNINKIKQINIPKPEKEIRPRVALDNIKEKLRKALEAKAEKEFKKKGATTDKGPEIIDTTDV